MKKPITLARKYLRNILGDRGGLDYRDIVQNEDIEDEIETELAMFILEIRNETLREAIRIAGKYLDYDSTRTSAPIIKELEELLEPELLDDEV